MMDTGLEEGQAQEIIDAVVDEQYEAFKSMEEVEKKAFLIRVAGGHPDLVREVFEEESCKDTVQVYSM